MEAGPSNSAQDEPEPSSTPRVQRLVRRFSQTDERVEPLRTPAPIKTRPPSSWQSESRTGMEASGTISFV
eukprot:scaffold295533_cov37-Prasinocladus_malaysianus.AAC.1